MIYCIVIPVPPVPLLHAACYYGEFREAFQLVMDINTKCTLAILGNILYSVDFFFCKILDDH